jgi:hypothetical protein
MNREAGGIMRSKHTPSFPTRSTASIAAVCALIGWLPLAHPIAARAETPDPTVSTIPFTIYVVTPIDGGPDIDGANGPSYDGGLPVLVGANSSNVVVIKDFTGTPRPGVGVHFRLPCDISLCSASPGAPYATTWQQTVTCDETGCTLHVVTDENGRAEFVALGAARDPGGYTGPLAGGGGHNSTIVTVDGFAGTYRLTSAAALDQNGAAGIGAGVTAADAGIILGTAFVHGDRARADLDGNGAVSPLDAAIELGHAFRLALATTGGCAGTYAAIAPCP